MRCSRFAVWEKPYHSLAGKLNRPIHRLPDGFFRRVCNAARLAGRDGHRIPVLNLISSFVVVDALLRDHAGSYAGRVRGSGALLIPERILHRNRGSAQRMTVLVCNYQCIRPIDIKAHCFLVVVLSRNKTVCRIHSGAKRGIADVHVGNRAEAVLSNREIPRARWELRTLVERGVDERQIVRTVPIEPENSGVSRERIVRARESGGWPGVFR